MQGENKLRLNSVQAMLTQWPPQAGPRGQKPGRVTTTTKHTGFMNVTAHLPPDTPSAEST